jgi:ABC-type amino acid transport substrate-binding protein
MKKTVSMILAVIMLAVCALGMVSCKDNSYSSLQIVDIGQEKEYFGIAFRSGSDLTRKVEDITLELIKDGKLEELSTKYEVGAMGKDEYTPKADPCASSDDFAKIKAKGKLVIGITDYKPMDYKDENGEWIGFDADYAKMVCEKLGVTAEFKEIDWDNKLMELAGGTIDCIWNGMTITDAIENAADCTTPYMYNTQVAVIKKANAEKYKDLKSMAGVAIVAEGGSAGEALVKNDAALAGGLKSVAAQNDAILEVLSGTSEVAIVDMTLAKALIK